MSVATTVPRASAPVAEPKKISTFNEGPGWADDQGRSTLGRGAKEIVTTAPAATRRVGWAVGLALSASVAVTVGLSFTRRSPVVPPVATPRPLAAAIPAPVVETFRAAVLIEPGAARVRLDGVDIGAGSFAREMRRDGVTHVLEIAAEGYEPQRVAFTDVAPPGAITLVPVRPVVAERVTPQPRGTAARRTGNTGVAPVVAPVVTAPGPTTPPTQPPAPTEAPPPRRATGANGSPLLGGEE